MHSLIQKGKDRTSFCPEIADHGEVKFLKESEEKYRSLVESSGFGIATIDIRGRFTFVNDALCKSIGYSKKELIGKHFANFLHPEDKLWILKIFLNAWKYPTKRPSLEFRIVHKKGHVIHMYSTPTLFRRNRKIQGFSAIITDITERKKAEESLRKSEDRYRNIIELAPDGVITVDMNGVITSVNAAFSKFSGYSKDEIIGKHFTKLGALRADNIPEYLKLFDLTVAGNSLPPTEFVYLCKDGTERWGEAHIGFVESDGKRVGLQGILRDITERKKADQAIVENQQKFERLFRGVPEAAVHWDAEYRIWDINPRFTELFGYTLEEARGKGNIELIVPKDKVAESENLAKKTLEGYVDHETVRKRKDGSLVSVSISVAPIFVDHQLMGYVGLYKDITERKKNEEAVLVERDKLETVTKNIGVGLAVVSRDYRTLWANEVLKQLFGEVEGKTCYKTYNQRDEICPSCGVHEVFEHGKDRVVHEQVGKDVDGKIIWSDIIATPMKDKFGNITTALEVVVPITERKKAEEALQASEERYRNLFENARDVILTTDLEGNVTSINKAIEEYDWKREEIIGKNMLEFIFKESWPSLLKGMEQIAKGEPLEGEIELATPIGKKIAEYKSNPIIQDNKIVGVQVIGRDITERRAMEEKLRDSEEKFRAINASASDAILLIDNEGEFSYWNPAAEKMFGYTEEEVNNKKMYELITPQRFRGDHISAFEKFKETGRGNNIGKTVEIAAIRKDGTEFPVEFSLSALQVKGKQYALGIVRDITERKKMEEKLKQYSEHLEELVQKKTDELLESEKRYSVLVEESKDGVVIAQDERIVFVNKRAAEMLEYSKEELIGLNTQKVVTKDYYPIVKKRYAQRLRGREVPATYEIEFLTKTGLHVPIEINSTRINYQGRPAVLVMLRDLRERKRIEEQRLKLEKLATIGEFATMVAHDLRNPLTSIRNASFYIKNKCPHQASTECKTALEMVDTIERETLFANDIINELLDLVTSRKLQKNRQNVSEIIEHSIMANHVPENVKIERNLAEKTFVIADRKQLERVFLNLIKNAVQAMPKGGKLKIATNGTRDAVEIVFADTGIGIPEQNMSKIFMPFFTTKAKGIGIGLHICRKIIEEHAGTIVAESIVGQGSAFTIRLPKKTQVKNQ